MLRLIPFFMFLIFSLSLHAEGDKFPDILGLSPMMEANATKALQKWRDDTIALIRNNHYDNVILNTSTEEKRVALTFDDGPDENNTFAVLDILKAKNVKAAFFMIGTTMEEINATAVKRAADEGHLVLNHTYTHPHLKNLSGEAIRNELILTGEKIKSLTGHYPLLMRPPYGDVDANVLDVLRDEGYSAVLWSLDSLDWALHDKDEIVRVVLTTVRPGDIILMHCGQANHATVEALSDVIRGLREMGYSLVALNELRPITPYR